MTLNIDSEVCEWMDKSGSLDEKELKLKDGAPDHVKLKFAKYKRVCDEYEALWDSTEQRHRPLLGYTGLCLVYGAVLVLFNSRPVRDFRFLFLKVLKRLQ